MATALILAAHLRGGTFGPNAGLGLAVVGIVFYLLVRSPKIPKGK